MFCARLALSLQIMIKKLKILRIVLSVAFVALLTGALLCHDPEKASWIDWTCQLQLLPAVLSLAAGVCLFWLAVTLLVGRAYCSTVCPLGVVQDIFGRIGKMMRRNRDGSLRLYHYSRAENRLRYVVLAVVVLCVMVGQMFLPEIIDPYYVYANLLNHITAAVHPSLLGEVMIPGVLGIAISAVTLVVVAVLSFKNGRTFCNTICPVGSALSVVSRVSLLQLEIDPDVCTNCGRCEQECKASCIDAKAHTIDYSRCVLCMNCTAACNDHAIRFTATRKRLSTPLMQQIGGKVPQMTIDRPGQAVETTVPPANPVAAHKSSDETASS